MCAISVLALSHFVLSFLCVKKKKKNSASFLVYSIARVCVCVCLQELKLSSISLHGIRAWLWPRGAVRSKQEQPKKRSCPTTPLAAVIPEVPATVSD